MSESAELPNNFGGIAEEEFSDRDSARVLVWPISYEGTVSYGTGTGKGAMAIIDASRNMELYEEETGAEVYKIGSTRSMNSCRCPRPTR
jgi:Arginase family.